MRALVLGLGVAMVAAAPAGAVQTTQVSSSVVRLKGSMTLRSAGPSRAFLQGEACGRPDGLVVCGGRTKGTVRRLDGCGKRIVPHIRWRDGVPVKLCKGTNRFRYTLRVRGLRYEFVPPPVGWGVAGDSYWNGESFWDSVRLVPMALRRAELFVDRPEKEVAR